MDISKEYTKMRFDFGSQPQFCEQGPEMCDSILPDVTLQKLFLLRNPVHRETQSVPVFSQIDINTIRSEYTSSGMNHAEGGWPRDVHSLDIEATQRYRRKIEKDDNYVHCVMQTHPGLEHYILQNNAIEMYQTYYEEMMPQPPIERNSVRTINEFKDFTSSSSRAVSSISWQPEGGKRFAVTYVNVDFNRIPLAVLDAAIWDINHPSSPEIRINAECPIVDLQFSPRDKNVLAGGLMSGQVGFWDKRTAGQPLGICSPHVAHRDYVRNVLFISSKSGQEFFSGSPDGACKWWDMRKIQEPIDEMIIDTVKTSNEVPSMENSHGISALEYEPTLPTRFMVGTENGLIIVGNRKGKSALEMLPVKYNAHVGPVLSVERSPGFLKNFLTVGDWTLRVFSDECRESPVIWSPSMRHKITSATWSPTRFYVFLIEIYRDVNRLSLILMAQYNGVLGLWDLLRKQHEPSLTIQICEEPLLRLKVHESGAMVGCGSQKGNVYMVEMSQNLTQSEKNDKALMSAILERESKRERILEARVREIRLKMKQAEEGSLEHFTTDMDIVAGDNDLIEATAEYMATVKKELALS